MKAFNLPKLTSFLLYASAIAGVVGGFFAIQAAGAKLVASAANPATVFGGAATRAHAADLLHILLALMAVVAMARVVGALFQAIQQPPVIGEIVAGIMLAHRCSGG